MKFGLFYQLPCAPTQEVAARYQETIEQIVYAEALGFDAAWLAELHFNPLFSVMPVPLLLAAAPTPTSVAHSRGSSGSRSAQPGAIRARGRPGHDHHSLSGI